MPDATDPANAANAAIQRAIIDALRSGRDLRAIVEALAPGHLSEQQRGALDLLEALHAREQEETAAAAAPAAPDDDAARELADLREVNDTAAAALGACRVCWGGDVACPQCGGHGRPGSSLPDPELFDALVAPAVRRMAAARGRARRPDVRAPRSPSTEAST